jgi:choline-sulfatase
MVDEMRYPPIYESAATKAFRQQYLLTQNLLRQHGVEFHRHYAASVACSPSRASIYTGHYPSLHGVTQTTGAAKESFDPDVFWLDPNSVPTFGDYFRAAGYNTFLKGKWHASDADMVIPGTHDQLVSYDPNTGAPDPSKEALYLEADRLDRFGFSRWIGPSRMAGRRSTADRRLKTGRAVTWGSPSRPKASSSSSMPAVAPSPG